MIISSIIINFKLEMETFKHVFSNNYDIPHFCAFDILWKYVFRLAFYSKLKCIVLIDRIVSEIIWLSVLIFIKLNLLRKVGLIFSISTVSWIFGK